MVINSMSELDDLRQANKKAQLDTSIIDREEMPFNEWIKEKIICWQNGESIGLGAREKGTCIAYLYNEVNRLAEEVEKLKEQVGKQK